ncbi:MAG: AgmX/PglI C-terminal domain-containing protein [Myxococcota bacterium]
MTERGRRRELSSKSGVRQRVVIEAIVRWRGTVLSRRIERRAFRSSRGLPVASRVLAEQVAGVWSVHVPAEFVATVTERCASYREPAPVTGTIRLSKGATIALRAGDLDFAFRVVDVPPPPARAPLVGRRALAYVLGTIAFASCFLAVGALLPPAMAEVPLPAPTMRVVRASLGSPELDKALAEPKPARRTPALLGVFDFPVQEEPSWSAEALLAPDWRRPPGGDPRNVWRHVLEDEVARFHAHPDPVLRTVPPPRNGWTLPRVRESRFVVDGALSESLIRRVVRRHRSELRFCYERLLERLPTREGSVAARFVIEPTGAVRRGRATGLDETTAHCVEEALRRWAFPGEASSTLVRFRASFSLE